MRRNSLVGQIFSLVVSLLIVAAGLIGLRALLYRPEAEASAKTPAPAPLVHTQAIRPHVGSLDIAVDGVVTPFREIEVAAEVAGKVVFKDEACNGGRFVKGKTVLIEIDPRDYDNARQRLENQQEQAVASLEELQVEIGNTQKLIENAEKQAQLEQKEVDRLKDLADQGIVTASTWDRAKQIVLAADNSVLQLSNQLTLLESRRRRLESARDLVATDLQQAELDLSRTKIVTPVDGVIIEDFVEQDSFVQKGASLFKLQDTSKVEVKCRLKMEELYWVWRHIGQESIGPGGGSSSYEIPQVPVTISFRLSERPGVSYEWDGVLDRFEGSGLDEATRTVPCRVRVDKPRDVAIAIDHIEAGDEEVPSVTPPALVSGMFVKVWLKIEQPSPLLQIPEQAVQPGKIVWIVNRDRLEEKTSLDLIELIQVKDAAGDEEAYWLVEANATGLAADDRVVVPPFGVLNNGEVVREDAAR